MKEEGTNSMDNHSNENIQILQKKGKQMSEKGKLNEALLCYERAINLDPNNSESWIFKGDVLVDLGRMEDALICSEQALKIDEKSVIALI